MSDIKGVIFDLDGTLIDSLGVWDKIDCDFFKKRGLPLCSDYKEAIKCKGFEDAALYTIGRFHLDETASEIMEEWNSMAEYEYTHNIRLKPGAKEFITRLRSLKIKTALATSSRKTLYEPVLRNNGIYECFDAFTATDEVKREKSFPDIYLLTAEKLKLNPRDCLVFEDILQGVRGAKRAGMRVVGIRDIYSENDREEIEKLADGFIEDFRNGEEILKKISEI